MWLDPVITRTFQSSRESWPELAEMSEDAPCSVEKKVCNGGLASHSLLSDLQGLLAIPIYSTYNSTLRHTNESY